MLNKDKIKEIKKLIYQGYDLEIMSFEFDIPIEQLKIYDEKLRKNSSTIKLSAEEYINKKNIEYSKKIKQIRENYKRLYYDKSKDEQKSKIENILKREVNSEEIDKIIKDIREEIVQVNQLHDKKEIDKSIRQIRIYLKGIEKLDLNIDQLSEILNLVSSIKKQDEIKKSMEKKVVRKFIETIDAYQIETDNIEELKILRKMLSNNLKKHNYNFSTSVEFKINNKISKIQSENYRVKATQKIPNEIKQIIIDLSKGLLDIEKSKEIIKEEARKQVQSNKGKFALSQAQREKMILNQIKTNISHDNDEWYITDPEKFILQMSQLLNGDMDSSINSVVKNLIYRKDYTIARSICEKYKNINNSYIIDTLRKDIKRAEIGEFVLKGIQMNGSIEEERRYFEKIEKGLKEGKINLALIPLGKSEDGTRKISLKDIWVEEKII